nr:hypothetical protein [Crucivirus sp.]
MPLYRKRARSYAPRSYRRIGSMYGRRRRIRGMGDYKTFTDWDGNVARGAGSLIGGALGAMIPGVGAIGGLIGSGLGTLAGNAFHKITGNVSLLILTLSFSRRSW